MTSKLPTQVERWLASVEADTPKACPEIHALAAHIRHVFETEDIYVDQAQLDHYLSLARYFPYDGLFDWEEAQLALWLCTYHADGRPRWKTLLDLIARGAGKDGAIAFFSFCLISPYNPVKYYDVDICATKEEQAMTPCADVIEALEGPHKAKLDKHYYHTKELIQGRKNRGIMRGRTNNPKSHDGMRSGAVIFNEVHAYENYANIKVFITGQGKRAQPRVGIFSSNGEVSDGPLDDYIARARRILFEGEDDDGFLPFLFCLSERDQVHDEANWHMANPSLKYLPNLLQETRDEYRGWVENPEQNGDFLTKRMNLRAGFQEIAVTEYDKVRATNKPLPDLTGWDCTVGIDYAELSDWAAVNFHFRRGADRFDLCHAWLCLQSKTLPRVRAPWQKWAESGILTAVDDVSISPDLLAEYIARLGQLYNIRKLALDNFRWTLLADSLRRIGFDAQDKTRVKLVRPSDIMTVEPVIQECFDRGLFTWGDNPALRWAVNNTKRVRSSKKLGVDTGNYIYAKIEGKSRKTDMFMALVASMTVEPELGDGLPLYIPETIFYAY